MPLPAHAWTLTHNGLSFFTLSSVTLSLPSLSIFMPSSHAQWLMLLALLLSAGVVALAFLLHERPSKLPGARLMGLIGDFVLSKDPEQRVLGQRHLVGTANCLAGIVALNYGVSLGVVDPVACRWLSVSGCLVILGFYVLLRTNLNRRFRDPAMAEVQMLFTVMFLAWGYAIGGPGRPIALILMFVILMFGMFTSTSRQLVRTCIVATLAFGVVMWRTAEQDRHLSYGPQLQLVYFCVLLVVLISICLLVAQLASLRQRTHSQQRELREALDRIQKLATRDELTGLFNRRHMLELLNSEKHRSIRTGRGFCLAMIDVDHFKRVNDQHGHATGDQVLAAVAQTISSGLRETDVVARWGGEEFLVMFTDTDSAAAEMVLSRIQFRLLTLVVCPEAPQLRVRFSAGITTYLKDELLTRTIDRADRALYEAKAAGRNRVHLAAA